MRALQIKISALLSICALSIIWPVAWLSGLEFKRGPALGFVVSVSLFSVWLCCVIVGKAVDSVKKGQR